MGWMGHPLTWQRRDGVGVGRISTYLAGGGGGVINAGGPVLHVTNAENSLREKFE